jgi:hypothetical protein
MQEDDPGNCAGDGDAEPAQKPTGRGEADEYDLAVDLQVEKFVETKQKLTYFLITASAVSIAFLVDFFVENVRVRGRFVATDLETSLVTAACIAGLVAAGLSLLNLRFEHRSYSRHLGHRYRRETWDSLSAAQQARWEGLNRWASRFLAGAFVFLFLEIALAVIFFIIFLW